ncbi:MAG: YkvA family protein [Candidatus Rokuibacteriota bacterium]
MKTLLRALPDLARLIARLVADPVLPRSAKIALVAALVYLASPLDLLPDVIPFLGYLDDVLLAAVIVDGIVNHVDRRLLLKYWPGTPESLDTLGRAARLFAVWVPRRIKQRLFAAR